MLDNAQKVDLARATQSLPISAENLTYNANGHCLLHVKNLEITAGGPTILLGPNGAGKSLLLRLLHGLIKPTSGGVRINGVAPDLALHRRQAMVFQQPVLLRRSVAANIAYALKVSGISGAVRRHKLGQLLDQCGLKKQAGQPARTLSGGEQQRLAFVRAMASEPDVLFLDEPTSSLDPSACDEIETLIRRASLSGTKIIMVTHDLALAQRLGDEIIFLHDGQVCEKTGGEEFFRRPVSDLARAFLARNRAIWDEENE